MKADRRTPGIHRVKVETTVEICGRDAQVPPFEAESIELSGRGMHVRTDYLPELKAPLVLRFEDRGREVIVEGEVAWRRELQNSGEFGIKFTALDSKSVEVLRELCRAPAKPEARAKESDAQAEVEPGAPVKLHIEGLGAPMKARVRDGGSRRLQVGSNLEFLRVGRAIEVEEVGQSERRDAKIDSVTVAIDPETQIPQLVVALRYAGELTPEPSVVDYEDEASGGTPLDYADFKQAPANAPIRARSKPAPRQSSPEAARESDGEEQEAEEAERARVGSAYDDADEYEEYDEESPAPHPVAVRAQELAQHAERLAQRSGVALGRFTQGATRQLGGLFRGAVQQLRERKPQREAPKRKTAPPPAQNFASEARRPRLSPQRRTAPAPAPTRTVSKASLVKRGAIGLAVLLAVAGLARVFFPSPSKPATAARVSTELEAPAPALAAKASQASLPALGEDPNPGAADEAAAGTLEQDDQQGIVADIPLFGPTTLATAAPAPLGVPEEGDEAFEDQALDQAFAPAPAETAEAPSESDEAATASAEDVKPWGKGRLHLPTIHRLKLDAPGTQIKGFTRADGFAVVFPGRKVVDNAKVIAKRDDRIKSVTADVSPEGAVVTFKFRGPVPPYKVRFKKDFAEFFISAPTR